MSTITYVVSGGLVFFRRDNDPTVYVISRDKFETLVTGNRETQA